MDFYVFKSLLDADPRQVGRYVGALLLTLVALLLCSWAQKCRRMAARQRTHARCVTSLAVVLWLLAGWLLVAIVNTVAPLPAVIHHTTGGLFLLAEAVCWLLALVALVDYFKPKNKDLYDEGWVQAAGALVLTSLPLVAIAAVFTAGVVDGFRTAWRRHQVAQVESIDRQEERNDGKLQRFQALNFQFEGPQDWSQLHAESFNPESCLAYVSKNPQSFFCVVAERVGKEVEPSAAELAEVVKSRLYAADNLVKISDPTPLTVDGIEGLRFEATAGDRQAKQSVYWVGSHGGITYELVSSCDARHAAQLGERHDTMMQRFSVIDREHVAHATGVHPVKELESKHYGYCLDLSHDDWSTFPLGHEIFPAAQYTAALGTDTLLGIVPVYLPEVDVKMDDLCEALAATIIPDFKPSARTEVEELPVSDGQIVAFCYNQTGVTGEVRSYRFRAVKHGRRAFLLAAFSTDPSSEIWDQVDAAFNRLSLNKRFKTSNAVGNPDQKFLRGAAINLLGCAAFKRRDIDGAKRCFEEAMALQPQFLRPLENYIHAMLEDGDADRAIAELQQRKSQYPDVAALEADVAKSLVVQGDLPRGRQMLEELFQHGRRDEQELYVLVALQTKDEDYAAALATVQTYSRDQPGPAIEQLHATVLSKKGDHAEALELLTRLRQQRPNDAELLQSLAEAYYRAGQFDQALAAADEIAAIGQDSEEIQLFRGHCQMALDRHKDAKESFQLALATNPLSQEAREMVTLASGMLGQGNTTLVATPIEAVAIPLEIQERLSGLSATDALGADYGALEIYRVTGYDYVKDDHWRTTTHRRIKIVGAEGVSRFKSLTIEFNPLGERVYVNRLAVFDEAGTLVAEGDPNDYYVLESSSEELATGGHTLTIPTPQLKPGYTLEYVATRETLGNDEFGFETVVLASSIPVQVAALFITGDIDQIAHTTSGPEAREGHRGQLRYWGVNDPPVVVDESRQPPPEDYLPVVHLGDVGRSWETLGREYYEKIADRLQPDEAVAQKAAEITAGLATPAEKIDALVRFVQREINYQGLEFGVRGLMPNRASRTLEVGYGDCKDHAVLLAQLLQSIGVPAQLTLVQSSGRLNERLPNMGQFDHMIVSLPGASGGDEGRVFVDCTSKYSDPTTTLLFEHDSPQVLVLDPATPHMVRAPRRAPNAATLRCSRDVTIVLPASNAETADAHVREQIWFSPHAGSPLRGLLSRIEPRERAAAVATLLREQEKLLIMNLDVQNLESPADPLVLQLAYTVEDAFQRTAGGAGPYVGRVPAPWEGIWLDQDEQHRRVTPFRNASSRLEATTRLVLPPGLAVAGLIEPMRSPEGNRFYAWATDGNPTTRETQILVQLQPGAFAAAEYEAYRSEAKQVLNVLRRPITLSLQ